MKSNVDKLSLNQVQSTLTLNSKVKSTSLLKKKVDVTLHLFNNHRPQFYFRTTDITGLNQTSSRYWEMAMPDNVTIDNRRWVDSPNRRRTRYHILSVRWTYCWSVWLQKSKLNWFSSQGRTPFKSDTKESCLARFFLDIEQ